MRYLPIVLSLLLVPSVVAAEKLTPRPLDPISAETFARAVEGSARVRSLVAVLERSNVIVHIQTVPQMPGGIGGMTRFVTTRGGYRYLRITLGADMRLNLRASILGHELQHAVEVANSSASDVESMRELFENEGHRAGQYFETLAAIQTERFVRIELEARQALQAEPVIKFDH